MRLLEKVCGLCRRSRRGAAAVEFALVAPLFFLLIFGMLEFGRMVMVQQLLTNASREGARLGVLDGQTRQDVIDKVKAALPSIPTDGGLEVTVNPDSAFPAEYGEPVEVTVRIPFSEVSWLPAPMFIKSQDGFMLTAETVMRRETVQ